MASFLKLADAGLVQDIDLVSSRPGFMLPPPPTAPPQRPPRAETNRPSRLDTEDGTSIVPFLELRTVFVPLSPPPLEVLTCHPFFISIAREEGPVSICTWAAILRLPNKFPGPLQGSRHPLYSFTTPA